MKLVYIEWMDHISFTEAMWRDEEEYEDLEPCVCNTVGWVLKETDDYVIVVQNKTVQPGDSAYSSKYVGEMCIIKGCIKEMKELK